MALRWRWPAVGGGGGGGGGAAARSAPPLAFRAHRSTRLPTMPTMHDANKGNPRGNRRLSVDDMAGYRGMAKQRSAAATDSAARWSVSQDGTRSAGEEVMFMRCLGSSFVLTD